MSTLSTLRSRRFEARKSNSSLQIITFKLASEWFALPILEIQKVVMLGKVSGDPSGRGIGVTTHENQEVLIVDVAVQIFDRSSTSETKTLFLDNQLQRYLVLLTDQNNNIIGLPIDCQPAMQRIHQADFKPLPEAYLASGNIQCISGQIIDLDDHPPLFLLDKSKLIEYFNC